MAAEQRTDRREGAEARLGLLPWSREAAVGWSKGLGHERGKDQATEAISGKGERGYNDSRFLTKTWRRCLCCALVSGAEEVQAPPSSTQQQVLDEIRNNPNVTHDKLAMAIGKSATTAQKAVRFLRENGYIERVGSDRAGWWRVL